MLLKQSLSDYQLIFHEIILCFNCLFLLEFAVNHVDFQNKSMSIAQRIVNKTVLKMQ